MTAQKPLPVRWSVRLIGALILVSVLSVCADQGPGDDGPDLDVTALPTDAQVSNPVELTAASGLSASILQAEGEDDLVYVSLPSGTVANGFKASVRRVGDEVAVIITMHDGGFDPVSVLAGPTDTVEIVVTKLDGSTLSTKAPVRPKRPPTVVRTWPPRTKSDMPLNSSMVVVFSEPLDPATITTSNVKAFAGRREIPGQVRVLPGDGTTIAFKPNTALQPNREYRLVISGGVADLEGEAVGTQAVLGFATGETTLGAPASIRVTPDSIVLIAGTTYQLSAKVFDANENLLPDQQVTWSTFHPDAISISSTGFVTAKALAGESWQGADIVAAVGDIQWPAHVVVIPAPASLEVTPTAATLGVGDTLALEVTAKSASGARIFPALTITNSNPATAVIVSPQFPSQLQIDPFRTVRALTPGVANITVKAGGLTASTEITVTPPRTVGMVRIAPALLEIMAGENRQLTAWLRDANGVPIQGSLPITWSSSNSAVVSIGPNGLIGGQANGTATITATSEGVNGTATITVTADAAAPNFATISASGFRTCAVTTSADTYCWGMTPLGDGDNSGVQSKNRPTLVAGGFDFVAVSAGNGFASCGRAALNALYCWGGTGSSFSTVPLRFAPSIEFSDYSAGGNFHACGLSPSGTVYCWGSNDLGQIGDGTTQSRGTPTQPTGGRTFNSVTTGAAHTCAITVAGETYCWGNSSGGKLGIGDPPTSAVTVPTQVLGGRTFSQISAGTSHTCAITAQGEAYCWGFNNNGQLGDGTQTNRSEPVAVSGGLTFSAITSGDGHTCGLVTGGAAYCWGSNFAGRLGVNEADDCVGGSCKRTPVAVQGGLSFVRISAGALHTCAMTAGGRLYCWGHNLYGMLGDGTNVDRSAPTPVTRPTP